MNDSGGNVLPDTTYSLTDDGWDRLQSLNEKIQKQDLTAEQSRLLWVLQQYQKGKTTPMTGLMMGRVFNDAVHSGYLRAKRSA